MSTMSSIQRFSSRRQPLHHSYLRDRLAGAVAYRRIAGYFRSSIFELVGEEIADIPDVRILCNSDLDVADIAVSKAAREAALKERWNSVPVEVEALLHRDRYRRLYDLLARGTVQVRVVPKDKVFLHGKAGVIEHVGPDGARHKRCFLGSINETASAFAHNYEILWEDTSPEGVAWVEAEFDALWRDAYPLPDAIVEEVRRIAQRTEIRFAQVTPTELPAATLAEAPIYRGGEQLQPWQRAFVALFLDHRDTYGHARLLLADEVGLGKTLSLAASAMLAALLDDGPVLILCPSTLTLQWQVELKDRLGIPSAVWHSTRKVWLDPNGHVIRTNGAEDVGRCPFRIAIVSTGLIFQQSVERATLLKRRYGTVVLDEAHKARRSGGLGEKKDAPNNLLAFMLEIGQRAKHILLGTATPIQTEVQELWDLLKILNTGVEHVLGREPASYWADFARALPYVKGEVTPVDRREAWELVRNPLPPAKEAQLFFTLRNELEADRRRFFSDVGYGTLNYPAQEGLYAALDGDFLKLHNPVVRHTVLRRRATLEEQGLLERVGVDVHPHPFGGAALYPGQNFIGQGLMTNHPFNLAYTAAQEFTEALAARTKAAGFMKSLLLQRICSSFASGRATATKMLRRDLLEDEDDAARLKQALDGLTPHEAACLEVIHTELSRPEARDPKLGAVTYFLNEHRVEGKTWLEHRCIIFSQYYDTAYWVAAELAQVIPGEVVAVYAGLGKSGLFRDGEFGAVEREEIKAAVKARAIRLVVATDAACEGLNLQTLGTLINVDLPWNPSRLEQRLGRIKRFGQARRTVDMLNLVYHDTQDEKVYAVLSRRLKDKFDLFGGLPDTIEDEWIDTQEELEAKMDQYIHLREQAKNAFEIRYQPTIAPDAHRWDLCARVLSRRDIVEKLSEPW
jgi:superfamily II DNA or RNA helicase